MRRKEYNFSSIRKEKLYFFTRHNEITMNIDLLPCGAWNGCLLWLQWCPAADVPSVSQKIRASVCGETAEVSCSLSGLFVNG